MRDVKQNWRHRPSEWFPEIEENEIHRDFVVLPDANRKMQNITERFHTQKCSLSVFWRICENDFDGNHSIPRFVESTTRLPTSDGAVLQRTIYCSNSGQLKELVFADVDWDSWGAVSPCIKGLAPTCAALMTNYKSKVFPFTDGTRSAGGPDLALEMWVSQMAFSQPNST